MKTCVHLGEYLAEFFYNEKLFNTNYRENQNTNFVFNTFPLTRILYETIWKKYAIARQATYGNIT